MNEPRSMTPLIMLDALLVGLFIAIFVVALQVDADKRTPLYFFLAIMAVALLLAGAVTVRFLRASRW